MTLALPQPRRRRRCRSPHGNWLVYALVLAGLLALSVHRSPWWGLAVLWWLPVGIPLSAALFALAKLGTPKGYPGGAAGFLAVFAFHLTRRWPGLMLALLGVGRRR